MALLASLLVSLTVVPVLAYWFLRARPSGGAEPAEVRAGRRGEGAAQPAAARLPAGDPLRDPPPLVTAGCIGARLVAASAPFGLASRLKTNFFDQSGAGHPHRQPGAAGRHQPGRDRRGRQEGRGGARAHRRRRDYQVTVGSGRFGAVRRRRRRPTAPRSSVTLDEDADAARADATTLRDELDRAAPTSARSPSAAAAAAASAASSLQVDRAGRRPGGAGAGDRAGARGDGRHARRHRRDQRPGASSAPRSTSTVDRPAAAAAGLTEAAIGQAVAAGVPRAPARPGDPRRQRSRTWSSALRRRAGRRRRSCGTLPLADRAGVRCRWTRSPTSTRSTARSQVTRIDGDRSATVTGTADRRRPGRDHRRSCSKRLDALELPAGATLDASAASAPTRPTRSRDLGPGACSPRSRSSS